MILTALSGFLPMQILLFNNFSLNESSHFNYRLESLTLGLNVLTPCLTLLATVFIGRKLILLISTSAMTASMLFLAILSYVEDVFKFRVNKKIYSFSPFLSPDLCDLISTGPCLRLDNPDCLHLLPLLLPIWTRPDQLDFVDGADPDPCLGALGGAGCQLLVGLPTHILRHHRELVHCSRSGRYVRIRRKSGT